CRTSPDPSVSLQPSSCIALLAACSPVSYLRLSFLSFSIDTAPPEIYTLSLHDALPISRRVCTRSGRRIGNATKVWRRCRRRRPPDRKSTRLNSSHVSTSYAVFCLKKKKRAL